jgi:hypothetical protein
MRSIVAPAIAQVARGEVEHAVDGRGVPGPTLAFHPPAQALEHRFGIKGKRCEIHNRDPLCSRRADAQAM